MVVSSYFAVFAIMGALVAVSVLAPGLRDPVFGEDRWVEWATVAAFAVTAAIGARLWWRRRRSDLTLLAIAAFAVVAVLDELSFGERIFGYTPPRVMGTKLDAIHDLLLISKKVITAYSLHPRLVGAAILVGCLLLVGAATFVLLRRGWRLGLDRTSLLPVMAAILLTLAQAIDLNLGPLWRLKPLYVEEVFELGAGLLCMVFVGRRRHVAPIPAVKSDPAASTPSPKGRPRPPALRPR